ncbi:hypothetical protein [Rhizosphaericola mali]|uniref:Uncharacterized protein n=1 Tax=Rhizosphaericola mali TaxID=2545455 RepID=A0A5P2G159_9BACT|nr:hypothetical protein [Rhizosphaericola mali]QES87839.1 hypothetical protein E0W69_003870 [Rhizosphaericola mali]
MKKDIKILLVTLFIFQSFACMHMKKLRQYRDIYTSEFKLEYLERFLTLTYNNSPEIKSILLEDKSGYTEPILSPQDLFFIQSIAQKDADFIKKDSIASMGTRAEGAEGKQILFFLMKKIEDRKLEKIARKRFKITKKDPHYNSLLL